MVFISDSDAVPTIGVNSYVTVNEVTGYAESHAFHQDATIASRVRPFIFRAMDYIESFRNDYKGRKTSPTQSLQWPRTGVIIDDYEIDENVIPDEIKEAVAICAVEMAAGFDPNRPLKPAQDARTGKSVSVLSSSISERYLVDWGLADVLPHVDALLRPLLRDDIDEIKISL